MIGTIPLLDKKRAFRDRKADAESYDFAIFDTPCLLDTVDVLTLARMTDGIILVSRPGIIDERSAVAAKDTFKRSSQNVLGLLVNGILADT